MKKILVAIMSLGIMASTAQAEIGDGKIDFGKIADIIGEALGSINELPQEGPCLEVNLDDQQKAVIKSGFEDLRENLKQVRVEIKALVQDYFGTILDPNSTSDQAAAKSEALIDKLYELGELATDRINALNYVVLKPEQRGPMLKCVEHITAKVGHKKLVEICEAIKK